jgi:hypothetical protein
MYSMLVLTITFITVIAISTYKVDGTINVTNNYMEYEQQLEVDDDAGYIFDDYGKDINIKLEEEKDEN